MDLVARSDPAAGDFVGLLRSKHADAVGDVCQGALDHPDGKVRRRRKIMIQNVAMERMYHYRNARQPGGDPSQYARLGGVRVNNRRPHAAQKPVERDQRPQVLPGRNRARHLRDRVHPVVLTQEVRHVSILLVAAAGHQSRGIAEFGKLAR